MSGNIGRHSLLIELEGGLLDSFLSLAGALDRVELTGTAGVRSHLVQRYG
jgi:hypothetical protein